jgi:tetratricopeptide (TPR) repeat protein
LLGALYQGAGDQPTAESYFQRALAAHLSLPDQFKYTEANALANMAAIAKESGQAKVAATLYERAMPKFGSDFLARSNALYNLGLIYEDESDTESFNNAIVRYSQAVASYESSQQIDTDDPTPLKNLLHIGEVAKGIGNNQLAFKAYALVNKFAENGKNPSFTTRVIIKNPYIELSHAQAQAEMGSLFSASQPQNALESYTSALTIYRALASKSTDQVVKAKAEVEVERIGKILESLDAAPKKTPDK